MAQRFERLMEPGMIGPVKTRNRIIKTANGTSYMDPDQTCGERMIAYYERLAKGGVGFLVVESCGVEYPLGIQHVHYQPDGSYEGVQLHMDDDRLIPGFQRLTDTVHKAGCPVSIQFQHAGAWNPTGLLPRDMKIRDVKCASAMTEEELPGPDFLPCRAMTHQELEDQVDLWASAAERAWKAGFDACEINHATAHQGNTFLSRIWNKRDDEYGPQSYENRTRFIRNIIVEAKRRCGPEFAVHAIINAAEYNHPLATTLEEGVQISKLICEVADGLNVRGERYGHRGGVLQPDRLMYPEPPYDLPKDMDWSRRGDGASVPMAEAVKRAGVKVPVWTACRIDAEWGEKYLSEGRLDFVGMTRFLLADPDYPNKVREGRLEDVRPCLGCLHCFEMRNRNKKLECRVNGTLGREIIPEFQAKPVEKKKKVLVVGGGPSGMEAARIAAERGHEVVLYEKDGRMGGLVPLSAIVKDCETQELMDYVKHEQRELKKAGVTVRTGAVVTPDVVRAEKPDAVIVAAGAVHPEVGLPGYHRKSVIRTEKLYGMLNFWLKIFDSAGLQRLTHLWMPVGKTVVIMGGTLHGCELGEFLVKRGRRVIIAHDGPASQLGEEMGRDDLANLWPWFKQKYVSLWPDATYVEVTEDGLKIQQPDKRSYILKGKNVINTQDWAANTALVEQLSPLVAEIHVAGSAREPSLMADAVREGVAAGCAV
jgi:2,4-dienoyl-CoA reductase-like NADH-dependent reductase (Old Yellow Enzyme family)/ribulose 1,5-bisphosphate synthetase/thiazole synthase